MSRPGCTGRAGRWPSGPKAGDQGPIVPAGSRDLSWKTTRTTSARTGEETMEAGARDGVRRTVGLLMTVALLGLASSAGAPVQSHFALPDLGIGSPAFGPTVGAETTTRAAGGNTAGL